MRRFKLAVTIYLSLFVILTGCSSTSKNEKQNLRVCPQCHMELAKSNLYTSYFNKGGKSYYFDDIGCMVLWAKENKVNLDTLDAKVFTKDTKKYIDARKASYKIDEKTPMSYGFSAYENEQKGAIAFKEVILRMLRGENMANPKIRKQILGI